MARVSSPQEFADRWLQGMQGASAKYKTGVQNPKRDPIQAAIAAKGKWLQGVQDAAQRDSYAQGLSRHTQQSWTQASLDKGAQRLASGASGAKQKVSNFAGNFMAAISSVQSQVNNLPSLTLEDRINKSAAWQRGMAGYKGKLKS